jgi:hypothetical protein
VVQSGQLGIYSLEVKREGGVNSVNVICRARAGKCPLGLAD